MSWRSSFSFTGSPGFVPAENAQRPQGVPAARSAVAVLEREMDLARMGVLEQPPPVRLLLGPQHVDRLVHARIRGIAGRAEVLQAPQHVVVPAGREGEVQPR